MTLVKKVPTEITFGIRTVESTAKSGNDFKPLDEAITMDKRETERTIEIQIIDDNQWEPDLDFYVELYDPSQKGEEEIAPRMIGDDSICKITILDEDFLGTLTFETTDMKVYKGQLKF